MPKQTEACGRCGVTTVVDAVEDDGDGRNPFDGNRIEVDERQLRIANAPAIFAGRLKRRLDEAAHSLVYGSE